MVLNMLDICTELKLAIVAHLLPKDLKNLALCCKMMNCVVQPLIWAVRRVSYRQLVEPFNHTLVGFCKEIRIIDNGLNQLDELVLEDSEGKMEEGLILLLSSCNLEKLNLRYHPVLSHTTLLISHMDRLRELYLEGRSFQDKDIDMICSSCVAELKVLSVTDSTNTDQAYLRIGRLVHLEELAIVSSNITDKVLEDIKSQHLIKLNLSECDKLTNVGISHLSLLVHLQSLDLSGFELYNDAPCYIDDGGVEFMKTLINLRELDISYRENVTDTSLKHISVLNELRKLNVSCTSVTDSGLSYLRKLEKLTDLNLGNCYPVTNVSSLLDLPISKLNLESTYVSDGDLDHFHKFNSLKILDLSECEGISDDGVQCIVNLTSLEELFIEGTAVSEIGYFRLKQDLPNVRIHSEYDFPVGNGLAYYNLLRDDSDDSDSVLSHNSGSDDEDVDSEEDDSEDED